MTKTIEVIVKTIRELGNHVEPSQLLTKMDTKGYPEQEVKQAVLVAFDKHLVQLDAQFKLTVENSASIQAA